jgi:hypothetical protein
MHNPESFGKRLAALKQPGYAEPSHPCVRVANAVGTMNSPE